MVAEGGGENGSFVASWEPVLEERDDGLVLHSVRDQVPFFKVEVGCEGNLGPLKIWAEDGHDHLIDVKYVLGIVLGVFCTCTRCTPDDC